jgi:hypothetical protein
VSPESPHAERHPHESSCSSGSFYEKKTIDWETHIKSEGDSSDEGIVPNVGNILDNIRDLSSLNFINQESAKIPTVDPLDTDTVEDRANLAKI